MTTAAVAAGIIGRDDLSTRIRPVMKGVGRRRSEPGDKVPLTARLLLHQSLTARRAAGIMASVTASLIESSRRRFSASEADLARRLDEVSERLERIEEGLGTSSASKSPDSGR